MTDHDYCNLQIQRAHEVGNNLYNAILRAVGPYFDVDDRDLDWDMLPSTLGRLARKAEAAKMKPDLGEPKAAAGPSTRTNYDETGGPIEEPASKPPTGTSWERYRALEERVKELVADSNESLASVAAVEERLRALEEINPAACFDGLGSRVAEIEASITHLATIDDLSDISGRIGPPVPGGSLCAALREIGARVARLDEQSIDDGERLARLEAMHAPKARDPRVDPKAGA